MAAFNLADGATVNAGVGSYRGKGAHEQTLMRALLDGLACDNILLGDALFSTYFLWCELEQPVADAVFEQHGARRRSTDFRRGQRLDSYDHLMTLTKSRRRPDWVSRSTYETASDHVPT